MANRLLYTSILILLVTISVMGQRERGREVRRRNRQTTTTTTTYTPPIEETAELDAEYGAEKQSCVGEPGCEWKCSSNSPDPGCSCACTKPNKSDRESSFDSSYFNK